MAREVAKYPIFPAVRLSTTDAFYSAVENANPKLPVVDKDLNFTFEGCYTSQSNIKRATRVSEIIMPEAEVAALVSGIDYPAAELLKGWRHTLFNHFHDILPGSGVHATYEFAQGLFQEIQATAGAIRARSLRSLATRVNTLLASQAKVSLLGSGLGDGLGAGAGDPGVPGGVTAYNLGAASAEPVLLFNQKAWPRSETVLAKVWNKPLNEGSVVVRDSDGNEFKGQVVHKGNYWGHSFQTVAFRAENVPATGYKVYAIDNASDPTPGGAAGVVRELKDGTETMMHEIQNAGIMENEFLRVEVDSKSGAIKHLIDKETGVDFVPEAQVARRYRGLRRGPARYDLLGHRPDQADGATDRRWDVRHHPTRARTCGGQVRPGLPGLEHIGRDRPELRFAAG